MSVSADSVALQKTLSRFSFDTKKGPIVTKMASGGHASVFVWQWLDDIGSWTMYEPHVSNYLQKCYVDGMQKASLADICHNLKNYDVDLLAMQQRQIHTGWSQ